MSEQKQNTFDVKKLLAMLIRKAKYGPERMSLTLVEATSGMALAMCIRYSKML